MPPSVSAHRPVSYQSHVRRNLHQLHLNSVLAQAPALLFIFIHQRVSRMRNFPRQHIALIELRLFVRIRHLSGGYITSTMCHSEQSTQLFSKNISRTYVKIRPHSCDEQQSPHNPQSKSHPYKECTTHHIRKSQSITRVTPLMNTSPPKHCQVSYPYTHPSMGSKECW
jgi:hypothetical protein